MTPAAIAGQPALREVRLYGALGMRFGRVHRLAVATAAEAARALAVLLPGFRAALLAHRPGYVVRVGEPRRLRALDPEEVTHPVGRAAQIRIVPAVAGAKKGWGKIIAGVALLVAAPWMAGAVLSATGGSVAAASMTLSGAGTLGKALVLGGVIQLLSPQRLGDSRTEREASYALDGPVNTTSAGGPVPLIIGRMVVGSVTVSAGMSADDLVAPPLPALPVPPPLPAEQPPTLGFGPGDGGPP